MPIVYYVEEITGTNLDAEQGVCTDGTNLYVTSTTRLRKYGMSGGDKLADVDAFNGDVDVDHAGDCCHVAGKIYLTASNWPASTVRRVYVYNASDLSYSAKYNITANPPSGTEISGVSYDGTYFWLCTYRSTGADYIYKYNSTFVYQNENHELTDINLVQGTTWESDKLYVNGYDITDTTVYLYEFDDWVEARRQDIDVTSTAPYEGLDAYGGFMYIGKEHSGSLDPIWKHIFSPTPLEDARFRTKVYLDAYLDESKITKDNDSTAAFSVIYAFPDYPLDLEFLAASNPVDVLFLVGKPNSTPMLDSDQVASHYEEHVPITIAAIDKTGITGVKLCWKAERELRDVCENHPEGSRRSLETMRETTLRLGSTIIYQTEMSLNYVRRID